MTTTRRDLLKLGALAAASALPLAAWAKDAKPVARAKKPLDIRRRRMAARASSLPNEKKSHPDTMLSNGTTLKKKNSTKLLTNVAT